MLKSVVITRLCASVDRAASLRGAIAKTMRWTLMIAGGLPRACGQSTSADGTSGGDQIDVDIVLGSKFSILSNVRQSAIDL